MSANYFRETSNPEYSEYIALSRYCRWREDLGRRENWAEVCERVANFWKERFPEQAEDIDACFNAQKNLKVMGSMRANMTAGEALARDNVAGYNCSYTTISGEGESISLDHHMLDTPVVVHLKNPVDWDEIMYVLMCGTGAGFSVERQYINNLPKIGKPLNRRYYEPKDENYPGVPLEEISTLQNNVIIVEDSKYGWASAFRILVFELYNGNFDVTWDVTKLRPAGEPLKVFGGRSSGPEPLVDLFDFTKKLFIKADGRKLTSIECHDITCKIAEIVVVGGVRRCLPEDSPVHTTKGIKNIQDINVGDTVVTCGKEAKVKAVANSGKQQIYRINHQFGYIDCTARHRVAILTSPTEFEFKQAKDITKEDILMWDNKGYEGIQTSLPPFTEKLHFNSKPIYIPELTEDISWLVGIIHGDGHIGPRSIEITSATHERQILEDANEIFKSFGLEGKISKGHGNCLRLRVNSAPLCRWFLEHIKQPNKNIKIPAFILNANKNIRYAYLAGLFDSDGRAREDNIIEQVTTVYEGFSTDLLKLLAGLGIGVSYKKTKVKNENKKDYYTVRITGVSNRIFWLENIKPYSVSGKLDSIVATTGNGKDFKYPVSWFGNPSGWKKEGYITVQSAKDKGFISNDTEYYPSLVQDISETSIKNTYDIEVEDLEMFTTKGIVVHNSALISLSNPTDDRVRRAKMGAWWETNPQRGLANNSACYTEKPDFEFFLKEWHTLYESRSGERGMFSRVASQHKASENGRRDHTREFGTNPCSEIILRPQGFCNLSEVVIREYDTIETLEEKVRWATIIGTLQSTLTDFKYLRPIWKQNADEERLLGVSMTGIMDHPFMSGETESMPEDWYCGRNCRTLPEVLEHLRAYSVKVNKEWAEKLGINVSAAITCVKPSGTVSQLTDTASGIHPRFSDYYIRRVRSDIKDPLTDFLIDQHVPFEVDHLSSNVIIFSFPVKSPDHAVKVEEVGAIKQMDLWKIYYDHWCEHKPSITVYYKDAEFLEVGAWLYKNFDETSGISFLPYSDHSYKQAPYEAIDEITYHRMQKDFPEIDWEEFGWYEDEDTTKGTQELACSAGVCEIVDNV